MTSLTLSSLSLFALLSLTGCATAPDSSNVASAEPEACKVALLKPGRLSGSTAKPDTAIEKTEARAALSNSGYRMALLRTPTGQTGNIEEALRNCN